MDKHVFDQTRVGAEALDARDELASFRAAFAIADPEPLYLDGNSLGRPTRATLARVGELLEQQWAERLIRGWGEGWYDAPRRVGERIATLVGAAPGQVVIGDSTSVNLYKLIMAALAAQEGRDGIVTDTLNFPSDLYVIQGCIATLGNRHRLQLAQSADGIGVDLGVLERLIDRQTALVTLSQVTFKSGFVHDIEAVTRIAHDAGALVLWDLSHSVGAVPIELDRWGVDLAVGCTYKYLNGGPGAPAFLYVRAGLQERLRSPIWGWFGDRSPFAFDLEYTPAEGIGRFLAGTPPMLALSAIEPALDLVLEAGIDRIRRKSIAQTEYCIALADLWLAPLGFEVRSPRESERRGSHVSLGHRAAYRINRCLIEEMNVLPDFREPDSIRLGISALYTTFVEIWDAMERMRRATVERRYERWSDERQVVT